MDGVTGEMNLKTTSSLVEAACPVYGYDMKRGRNGIWYATGIFGQEAQ